MTLKYANTQAFSGSQDNYMASKLYKFSSYKHAGLLKTWNPVQPTKPPPIYGLVWCYKESPTLTSIVAWNLSCGYRLSPHRICHVDIVNRQSILSIVTLLLSIVALMLSHVHHRIARPLGPP